MSKHERLILFLVALAVLERVFGFGRDIYLARTYGPLIPDGVSLDWGNISALVAVLVNIGCAAWLVVEARALQLKAWVWSLFGLAFGIAGVVLFYVMQLHENRAKRNRSQPMINGDQ